MRTQQANAARQRGNALLEFALAFPMLIALLVGIVDFSRLFSLRTTLGSAARMGAQEVMLNYSAWTATGANITTLASNASAAAAGATNVTGISTQVTRLWACADVAGAESTYYTSPPGCASERTYVRVTATKAMAPLVPLAAIGFPTSLSAVAVARVK